MSRTTRGMGCPTTGPTSTLPLAKVQSSILLAPQVKRSVIFRLVVVVVVANTDGWKQSLQIMLYAHAVAGSREAARFLSPQDPSAAPGLAVSIMERKLRTYLRFNETFPGFGGYLPWFTSTEQDLTPTADWNNRVPGLDNGYIEFRPAVSVTNFSKRTSLGCLCLCSSLGKHWKALLCRTGQPVAEVDRLHQDYWSQGKYFLLHLSSSLLTSISRFSMKGKVKCAP